MGQEIKHKTMSIGGETDLFPLDVCQDELLQLLLRTRNVETRAFAQYSKYREMGNL
jgi:hypothetical protein